MLKKILIAVLALALCLPMALAEETLSPLGIGMPKSGACPCN